MKIVSWKPNMDMISDWLEGWLSNPGSPADWLRLAWFNGEPLPGSEWTRDAELNRWIANSESDPVAWEGCRRLLERTGSPDRPIPVALIQWARDVAIETIKKPKLRQGQHSTDNGWRETVHPVAGERQIQHQQTDESGQHLLIFHRSRRIALCRTRMAQHPAGASFGDAESLLHVVDTPAGDGQGLEVSPCGLLQYLVVEGQVGYRSP